MTMAQPDFVGKAWHQGADSDSAMAHRTISTDEVSEDLKRARTGVEHWLGQLQRRLSQPVGQARNRWERDICEATKMLLAYGRFLHSLSYVVETCQGKRPIQAWTPDMSSLAYKLFSMAVDAITEDAGRRKRIADRFAEFSESINDWCPGFALHHP